MKALTLIALTASVAGAQTTWHVDVHGTAPGTGTALDPYTSIQYAVDAPTTTVNDTVLVHPGVYEEHVVMNLPRHIVSSDGPLSTVIKAGAGTPTLRSWSSGASIEGFTLIKTAGLSSNKVVDMDDLTMTRCIILGKPAFPGVVFNSGTIDHCLITGCSDAIHFPPHFFGEFSNSIFWGNSGALVFDSSAQSIQVEIKYCIVDAVIGNGPNTNIVGPPLVRSLTGHDFHLRSTSPCIDAGDPTAPADPDGTRNDIGPLPFDASYAPFTTYCAAKINSLGCVPAIGASGNASATSAASFDIECINELSHRPGLLFYGLVPANTPYQGGYFCVQPPVKRTTVLDSGGTLGADDCSGIYSYDFNALIRAGTDAQLEPGTEVFAQFWSRDSASSFTTNRSDAISFTIAP